MATADRVPNIKELTYRCKYCGHWCCNKKVEGFPQNLPLTKTGSYGAQTTPEPTATWEEVYEATTISFTAVSGDTPAKIDDSEGLFAEKHFAPSWPLKVETTSGTNDGTSYTIAARGVAAGVLTLSSTDSLTTETAATAGTVTLSRRIYNPQDIGASGCPLCGSLNS